MLLAFITRFSEFRALVLLPCFLAGLCFVVYEMISLLSALKLEKTPRRLPISKAG